MSLKFGNMRRTACAGVCTLVLGLAAGLGAAAAANGQQNQPAPPTNPPAGQPQSQSAPSGSKSKPPTHITPEQAKQLFAMVDVLLKFSSDETGLPIKDNVKRQMTTRAAVESYLEEKFNDDEGAKRL